MAFDWSSFLLTIAIGLGSGLITGLGSLLISRYRVKRKFVKALHKAGIEVVMHDCDQCGAIYPDDAAFCFGCGKPIIGNKECEKCGTTLPDEALFCYLCKNRAQFKDEDDDVV
ncbi:MAG: double zinc ribbon domain-containing protein [Candidatus Heimdallarchaeota archaeon]